MPTWIDKQSVAKVFKRTILIDKRDSMDKVCVSLGGSLLSMQNGFNIRYATAMADVIKKEENMRFIVVCGGGYLCRSLQNMEREAGVKNMIVIDRVGMEITRINALMLRDIFSEKGLEVSPLIPRSLDEFRDLAKRYRVVVCGGFMEGISTDTDATLAAEATRCGLLINVGSIGYIYDKDPKKFKDAKKFKSLTYEQLREIVKGDKRQPGTHMIFDSVATNLVARSKIEVRFVDGEIKHFEAALRGKPHEGTIVKGGS